MITKLYIPSSSQYIECSEEEAKNFKQNLLDQGAIAWIVSINIELLNQ